MIIARSPFRVTLGGGGTDLPSYYEKFGGFLIAAAIDKYVYITLHDTFVPDLIVKYSELERVPEAAQLKHPIIREAFAMMDMDGRAILELTSMADIPAGTGLGRPAVSRRRCSRRCTRTKKISSTPPNSPRRRAKSKSGGSRNPSANRINTSRPMAASPASNFWRMAGSRRGR